MLERLKSVIPEVLLSKLRNYKIKKNRNREKERQIRFYEGDKVICPICNHQYRLFGPFGPNKRENAMCHNCGSLERHRLLWKYLNDRLGFFKRNRKIKLLHFAPEKMFYEIFYKVENIDYVPCDLTPEIYNYEGEIKVEEVDITNIPFEENHFDFILCNHVLEHIPNDKLAMGELYRVMKKGGSGIFQVPIKYDLKETYEDFSITTPEGREKAFGQDDHVRWYGQDYIKRLAHAGFNAKEDDYVKSFSSEDIFRFGFATSELIYFCTKL